MKLNSKDTLRALIKQRGLSYSEVGEMSDCHRTMVSALVNGHRSSCTPELAERLARCLSVPVEVLFAPQAPTASGHDDKGRAA